jgi:hypothetical protein
MAMLLLTCFVWCVWMFTKGIKVGRAYSGL